MTDSKIEQLKYSDPKTTLNFGLDICQLNSNNE